MLSKMTDYQKSRLKQYGEYFTPSNIVNDMCNLVDEYSSQIGSRFLEPACGDGNFLEEILLRKLAIVSKNYRSSLFDWECNAILAAGSIYGIELLPDNAERCRARLYQLWDKQYRIVSKRKQNIEVLKSIRAIFNRNIVCGDALTMLDTHGNPIVFSEWAFVKQGTIQRRDFVFSELTNGSNNTEQESNTFLKQQIMDYRRIWEYVD